MIRQAVILCGSLGTRLGALMAQTRRLIAEVLPLVAARWPKPAKPRVVNQAAE